ncbi:hypothetical protein DASC09_060250 [Saccharomycopsis crataegensis]|uniref:Uncharacterized protein n=1 Tax=Saccharomycopsis crataegensis TaxID=43959 RepID=A0AAV5QVZ5_9ASCO|nr:hypothetical protein DASC09_060250 [Saccharomycopsis crataegensis]
MTYVKSSLTSPGLPAITSEIDKSQALVVLPESLTPWKTSILSCGASLGSTIVGFPFDSIKTRMQTHKYSGSIDCLRQAIRHEGVAGLFRGITAPLLSIACSKSLAVSIYTYSKPQVAALQEQIVSSSSNKNHKNNEGTPSHRNLILANIPTTYIAGSFTGVMVTLFSCPFEFTKLYSQIGMIEGRKLGLNVTVPRTVVGVSKQIIQCEGIIGLYSGLKLHMFRELVGSGLYFAVYETTKLMINESIANGTGYISGTKIPVGPISIAIAGGLSGILTWAVVFPIDTNKSLIQRDIVSNIIRQQNGLEKTKVKARIHLPTRRMYRGLGVTVTRSVINSMVFFGAFEYLMKHVA